MMISKRDFLTSGAAFGLGLAPVLSTIVESSAQAADYPNGPVKIIIAQAAGGSLDVLLRVVAEHLGKAWGIQPVVLNMPGGGGVVAARTAAAAAPDGHNLFMASASAYTVMPETQKNLPFDVADFVPIGLTGEQPMAIAVAPALGVGSLAELIALSKRRPDGLNCAVGNRNSLAHLTGELLHARSGANLTFIYYAGISQAMNDVVSGRVPVLINVLPGIAGAIAGNKVKLLSLTSPTRLRNHPDVPAAVEAVPGFTVTGWTALVGPRGTPAAIVSKINDDLRALQARPEFQQQLESLGVFTRPVTPQQTAEFIRAEQQLWRPLVRQLVGNAK